MAKTSTLRPGGEWEMALNRPQHLSGSMSQLGRYCWKSRYRSAPKISRRTIFSCPRHCDALRDRYEGLWSLLRESMWSLTSPHAERTGGSENFVRQPKRLFQQYRSKADFQEWPLMARSGHSTKRRHRL